MVRSVILTESINNGKWLHSTFPNAKRSENGGGDSRMDTTKKRCIVLHDRSVHMQIIYNTCKVQVCIDLSWERSRWRTPKEKVHKLLEARICTMPRYRFDSGTLNNTQYSYEYKPNQLWSGDDTETLERAVRFGHPWRWVHTEIDNSDTKGLTICNPLSQLNAFTAPTQFRHGTDRFGVEFALTHPMQIVPNFNSENSNHDIDV